MIGGESRTECFVKQSLGIGMKSQNILKIRQFLNCTKPLLEYEGKNGRDFRMTMHVRLDMRIFQRTIFKNVCFLLSVATTLAR